MIDLDQKVESLPRVGYMYGKKLDKLGITTVRDLLYHFPARYVDLSVVVSIAALEIEIPATIQGEIWQIKNIRTKSGKFLTSAKLADSSGVVDLIWFNQPYLTRNIKNHQKINVSGKLTLFNSKPTMVSPEYEIITTAKELGGTLHTGRIVPIYHETAGVSSKWLRARIDAILKTSPQIPEFLPEFILRDEHFASVSQAVIDVHFPANLETLEDARRRLSFDELFIMQARTHLFKRLWNTKAKSKRLTVTDKSLRSFSSGLPFQLTKAQNRVIQEIREDIAQTRAMNRLLEGDVGSGKTVVAGIASLIAYQNGCQAVFMAPTEVLAIQHYQTLTDLFSHFGVKVALITGSRKPKKGSEKPDIIVGTHALLQEGVNFENVGLLVIDEQHRFGVAQRALLRSKTKTPHILTMTATPIPRTLALTLYGDLDLSVIDELPKNRLSIHTYVVPESKRAGAYSFIDKKIEAGEQAFIICPFIDPSETLETVKSAKAEYEKLTKEIFSHRRLALLHGKLKTKEKESILRGFKNHDYDILVATPVVEVGIDVPNATVMLVEGSERFGLSGLHQLRGRVGRGEVQSYCLLFTTSYSPNVLSRLKLLTQYHSGIKLAEMDLKMRGAGELYGTAQSGMVDFKIADITDGELIEKTKLYVSKLLEIDPTFKTWPLLEKAISEDPSHISPD